MPMMIPRCDNCDRERIDLGDVVLTRLIRRLRELGWLATDDGEFLVCPLCQHNHQIGPYSGPF